MPNKYQSIVEKLGGKPSYLPLAQPPTPVSEEQLAKIESQLGAPLPADYREFVRDYGGYIFNDNDEFFVAFPYGDGSEGTLSTFYEVSPGQLTLVDEYNWMLNLRMPLPAYYYPNLSLVHALEEGVEEVEWPEELLPIAYTPGLDLVGLAITGVGKGAVFFWNSNPGPEDKNFALIANSFDEFMHSLRESDS